MWRQGASRAQCKRAAYRLRPKAHGMVHIVEEKAPIFGNASRFWCYRDEDFIGVIKKTAAKCKHPSTLEQRVMEKLRITTGLSHQAER